MSDGTDRGAARAALLALLDNLAAPATVIVLTAAGPIGTFQLEALEGRKPPLVPGTLRAAIVGILEESDVRLTMGQLVDALAGVGMERSSRAIEKEIEAVRGVLIDNDRQAKPPGYGIVGRTYH